MNEALREPSPDPEAERQRKVLDQLQEELLDLQKTTDDDEPGPLARQEADPLDVGDIDDQPYLPPSNQEEYNNNIAKASQYFIQKL